jgi:hypothetical protein
MSNLGSRNVTTKFQNVAHHCRLRRDWRSLRRRWW